MIIKETVNVKLQKSFFLGQEQSSETSWSEKTTFSTTRQQYFRNEKHESVVSFTIFNLMFHLFLINITSDSALSMNTIHTLDSFQRTVQKEHIKLIENIEKLRNKQLKIGSNRSLLNKLESDDIDFDGTLHLNIGGKVYVFKRPKSQSYCPHPLGFILKVAGKWSHLFPKDKCGRIFSLISIIIVLIHRYSIVLTWLCGMGKRKQNLLKCPYHKI